MELWDNEDRKGEEEIGDYMIPIWLSPMLRWKEFDKFKKSVRGGKTPASVFGLSESQKLHTVASLVHPLEGQCLYITYSEEQAVKAYEDMSFFYPDQVLLFSKREVFFYKVEAYSPDVMMQRLKVLEKLACGYPIIVIASIEAVLFCQTPLKVFKEHIFTLKVGDETSVSGLAKKLVQMGYNKVDIVEGPGQFSMRGGIFDIFPLTSDKPYRIEFFDEEVDSIRYFDPVSQRSIEKTEELYISPARELVLEKESLKDGIAKIKQSLKLSMERLESIRENAKENIQGKINELIEKMEEGIYDETLENYLPFFYPQGTTILQYLDSSALVVLDEPARIRERFEGWKHEFEEHFVRLLQSGEVLPEQANIFISYDDFLAGLKEFQHVSVQALPRVSPDITPKITYHFMSRTIPAYQGKLELLADDIKFWKERKYSVILLSGSQPRGEGLASNLTDYGIEVTLQGGRDGEIVPGQVIVIPGSISKGFEYSEGKFVLVSDNEIYGVAKRRNRVKPSKAKRKKIEAFTDLKVGDYVVHENHGIGKYLGIKSLVVDGQKRDYLYIKYSGTDTLYVPTDQMDLIQPYIGLDDKKPRLSKLGGAEWQKTKNKVRQSIQKLAFDLLKLYAAREAAVGYSFSEDTPWQKQFEDMFPYEETPDQLRAIEEIKRDMESSKIMDRLLCGDVGYGKTEVAIRAAFKAVMDGKQVAVLAPTTILAQQHYNTFERRFEDFPITVQVLSRFKTPAEQKQIIKGIREGNIDVIIGTHRLLGKDVKYKDLGLLIIDEEQRFGVGHKETLKNIKKNVDVLTLTATPIPRTLHMSLIGIRDISVIETPPEDRYPVQTYVVEYNESLIRDAILREVQRGGQVYFVYNRVKSMEFMADRLRELVPEISIGIAHGQMSERILEKVMMDFYDQKFDLLLCSTIIENGLDLPNVNTIIVYDADYYGLSQLYQLRGRVGRSNRLAYAYFVYRKDKILSEAAEKRLQAIKEFTEFGAGFKIAMRDLEIRGAGNILGPQQHGHMAAVGYDLYCKLLEETVRSMKGEEIAVEIETSVDIKVDAYIEAEYISMESQRIEIYKRIAAIEDLQDKYDLEEELEDRFGDIPVPVQNLIDIAYIKALGKKMKIVEITHRGSGVFLKFADKKALDPRNLMIILNENQNKVSLEKREDLVLKIKLDEASPAKALGEAKSFLEKIIGLHRDKTSDIIEKSTAYKVAKGKDE